MCKARTRASNSATDLINYRSNNQSSRPDLDL